MRMVGVAPGDPFQPTTWSGTSARLFTAMRGAGFDVAGVNAEPHRLLDAIAKATTLHRRRSVWKGRYELSRVSRAASTVHALAGIRRVDRSPEVLLQVGAWCDLRRTPGVSPRARCSYNDGNLAVYLSRPGSLLDPEAPQVRRTLAYERRIYDALDLIFPMSEWLRRSFIEDFGQSPDKVIMVGAGPNIGQPEVPQRDWSQPRLLFVGRDFTRKGGGILLDAFRRVHAQRPDAELTIVGPPEAPPSQHGVRFVPPIERSSASAEEALRVLYADATVFVMPSLFEPFGIAFLEAMAHGLPVVATTACAMPEIVKDGVTGALAPPGDAIALADRILDLLSDAGRLRAMGEASRQRQLALYTWDRVGEHVRSAVETHLAARA